MNKNDFKAVRDKLLKDKKTLAVVAVGLLGMLTLLLSSFGGNEAEQTQEDYFLQQTERDKKELAQLISDVAGAGKTRVMITYDSSEELIFATDTDTSTAENKSDIKREHIIVDEGSDETGLVAKTVYPSVRGVAVVCQGGNNPIVKEQIISIVSALFDISTNKITVADMAE